MSNENALQNDTEVLTEDSFDLDELEAILQNQLEEEITESDLLVDEKANVADPEKIGEVIKNAIWDQVINQIGIKAGEEFIKKNRGLNLDLSHDAHFQGTENFANGIIATHNTEIDYNERYKSWQANFKRNPDGTIRMRKDRRTGKMKAVLIPGARKDFDKGRPKGSAQENIDEIVSVGEQLRDPAANAHLTKEEIVAFDNSNVNLNPMNSAANQSKGDSTMTEFLESERDGKKPAERFNINEEELRKKDAEAREEWNRIIAEGEKRSIEAGKKSRRNEAKRIGREALKAALMQLLAELIREIISKLVIWFKSADKNFKTFMLSLKDSIISFVNNLKKHLVNTVEIVITTVATAIFGPIIRTIKKVWLLLKQGLRSLKEAIDYLRNPENRGKSRGILALEIGKIVTAGLTAVGSILLSDAIEKGLMTIPGAGAFFSFEIPLLGSLANILGMFFGAVISGIIGAIILNMIDKAIAKTRRAELTSDIINKRNDIITTQGQLIAVTNRKLDHTKESVVTTLNARHQELGRIVVETNNITADDNSDNQSSFDEMNSTLKSLLS